MGCGHGISTLLMAKAFPKSEFWGFDLHPASIEAANRHAKEQQITNVHFSIATPKDFSVTLPPVYRGSTRLTHHMVWFWSARHGQAQSRVAQVREALPCGRPP